MTLCSPRVVLRGLLFGAFLFIALFFFGGRAHALDSTATASTPAPTPPTPAPVSETESTPPPNTSAASPPRSTPAGASGPDDTNSQSATVATQGTATANSGGNTASTTTSTTASPSAGNGTTATATSGPASSQGTSATSAITQQASGQASQDSTVDILQIALVVNIGNAQATSGGNVVGAGPTGTNTTGAVKTGTVSAVGDQAKTGITQSAVVTNGDASSQDAMVINVGIAVGNSGLNITIGTIGSGAAATTSNTAIASVSSGAARATGDASKSTIIQAASGSATGTASLLIDQRAYIVNFGIAIANTGGNFALASLDASSLTPEQQAVVQVLLQALAPLFGTASANGSSSVTTGSAKAVGTDATTTVSQNVRGVVSGDSAASAVQLAQVANIGFAVANSGLNGVGTAALGTDLAATQSSLDAFLGLLTNLDWLSGSNPSAQFAQTLNLGGLTVDLGGTLSANDMILGWDSAIAPDGGPLLTGVHVRQISAVLDIGFATADSGHNVVVAINGSAADATGNNVKLTRVTKKSSQRATIVTGNVVAVGNAATVTVCQAFNDGTACFVKTKTTLPGHKPEHAAPKPGVLRVAAITTRGASITASEVTVRPTSAPPAPASTLPFTGTDSTSLAEFGVALLGLGAVLTRRRARDRSREREE